MSDIVQISAGQIRAGRGLIGISQTELAELASVSRATIADFERGTRTPHQSNMDALRTALEAAGVEFIPENGGGAGVRLRKGSPA